MANAPSSTQPQKGSMVLFWVVIGIAVAVLAVYLARMGMAVGGRSPSSAHFGGKSRLTAVSKRTRLPSTIRLQAVSSAYRNVTETSLEGKVVVLHFWATWCPPCRTEFPEFARYAAGSHSGDDVVVVPVSVDDTEPPVTVYLQSIRKKFPVYMDSSGLSQKLRVTAIPTTVLVDRKGRIAWRRQGAADWSSRGVPSLVKDLRDE